VSPRPRKATDDDILRATFRALARRGPGRLTLADVADEAGVSAAALVHRFGSKRALLLTAAADVATGADYIFPDLRLRHRSPVRALLGLADCMSELLGSTPVGITHSLAFLQMHLTDPQFHRHALAASAGMRAGISSLVQDAMLAGEIEPCPPGPLASVLHAALSGSLANWVIHRTGDPAAWVRRDLRAVLVPYRTSSRPARTRRGARG